MNSELIVCCMITCKLCINSVTELLPDVFTICWNKNSAKFSHFAWKIHIDDMKLSKMFRLSRVFKTEQYVFQNVMSISFDIQKTVKITLTSCFQSIKTRSLPEGFAG